MKRVAWVDNLRGICMFGVLLLHTAGIGGYPYLSTYILSFVLAAFFFLSGVLLKLPKSKTDFWSYVVKCFKRLMIPYLIFSCISFVFWFFITRKIGGQAGLSIDPLKQLLGIIYGTWGKSLMMYNRPLWFFPCLFLVQIGAFFVLRLHSRWTVAWVTVCGAIIGNYVIAIEPYPIVPWGGEFALRYFPYLAAGYYAKSFLLSEKDEWTHLQCLAWAGFGAVIHICTLLFFADTFSGISYYIKGFSGIVCWLFLVFTLPPLPFFSAIGKESLTVFALHDLTYSVFTGLAVFVFGLPAGFKNDSLGLSVVYAVSAGCVLVMVAKLFHRYAPWVIGYRH